MYSFEYQKVATVTAATEKLSANADAKLLAGGQSMVASMKLRLASPLQIVDLGGVAELSSINVDAAGLTIGAMTRHAEVAASAEVKKTIPALASLAGSIGDRMVRNMGTIGGSVANSDPAADYPAGVLGLGATVVTNKRRIAADDFFKGMFETALQPGEIITSIIFPVPKRAAYVKLRNMASRYALVGVFVADTANGPRVAVTGAGPCAFRVAEMEKALSAKFVPESVAGLAISPDGLNADIHASPAYRADMVTVLAKRAVANALG